MLNRHLLRTTLYSLTLALSLAAVINADPNQRTAHAAEPARPFAYTVRPILFPLPPAGPVLPKVTLPPLAENSTEQLEYCGISPVNPIAFGKVHLASFALNDKGEAAFAVTWYKDKFDRVLSGGVYTEKRTVVSIGDVVAGERITNIYNVGINNHGQVSYSADTTRGIITQQSIFVERQLTIKDSHGSSYLFGEDGYIYLIGNLNPTSGYQRVDFTNDNITSYCSQPLPFLAAGNQTSNEEPNKRNLPIKFLPEDIVKKLRTLLRSPSSSMDIFDFYNPPYSVKIAPKAGFRGEYGGAGLLYDYFTYVTKKLSISKSEINAPMTNNNRRILTFFYAHPQHAFDGVKANGLEFSGGNPLGTSVGIGVGNTKGQILFPAPPTPDDTRMFVCALATPNIAPAPEPELASMRTDANRDGTITFDDADKSTPEHPYTFWLNNNSDVFMVHEQEDEDQNPALAKMMDSSLSKIPNARDLEDFERLQIKLPSDFNADSGQWEVTLELAPFSPTSGIPTINVVPAPTTGMDYLTGSDDQEIATLLSSSKVEITESKGTAAHGVSGTSLDSKLSTFKGDYPASVRGEDGG